MCGTEWWKMNVRLSEIARAVGGVVTGPDREVHGIVTDNREIKNGYTLFCAIRGARVDGHDYAAKAYQAGAEYVIANHPVEGVPEDHLVICESSYLAMIRMASNYRTLFSPLMIGVIAA